MKLTKSRNRWSIAALGAVLVVAFLAFAGCSATDRSPGHAAAHTPASHKAAPYTVRVAPVGYTFEDAVAGYAITFPQRPDVEPLANNESKKAAYFATDYVNPGEFGVTGQVLDHTPNLQAQLMGFVESLKPSGAVSASSYTLDGLDAAQAQFTTGKASGVPSDGVGLKAQVIVAGDGDDFYQLIAIGGTAEQRLTFFTSFERIDN